MRVMEGLPKFEIDIPPEKLKEYGRILQAEEKRLEQEGERLIEEANSLTQENRRARRGIAWVPDEKYLKRRQRLEEIDEYISFDLASGQARIRELLERVGEGLISEEDRRVIETLTAYSRASRPSQEHGRKRKTTT